MKKLWKLVIKKDQKSKEKLMFWMDGKQKEKKNREKTENFKTKIKEKNLRKKKSE